MASKKSATSKTSAKPLADIDHLKQAEEGQRQQSRLIESSYEPIFIWDFDTGIVEWNQGCEKFYGYTRAEAVGRNSHELLRSLKPPSPQEVKARMEAQGEWAGELCQLTKDGREVVVESRQRLSEAGGRRLVLETDHDITGRKQAEERLRESEERFRTMADSAPVLIWVNGADGGCQFANKAYLDFFGKTMEEVRGFGWGASIHPDDRERYVSSYLEAVNARAPFHAQARILNAKGEYRWFDSVGLPRFSDSGEFLGHVGASPDITETKQAELDTQFISQFGLDLGRLTQVDEMVRLATSKLGKYLGVARCYLGEITPEADLIIIREDWEGWLLLAPEMAGDYVIADFITPEFREAFEDGRPVVVNDVTTDPLTRDLAANYKPFDIGAFVFVPLFGETRWEAALIVDHRQSRNWRPDELRLIRSVAARLWPAVKQARADEALRESEERVRTMVGQMVAGVAECDTTGKFVLVNRRYCDIVGYTEAELLEMHVQDITHPDDLSRSIELYSRLVEAGASYVFEKRYRRKDGSEVWVNNSVSPTRDALGAIDGAVAVVIDVTDRKLAERELAAAKDRLAADLDAMTRLQRVGAVSMYESDLRVVLDEIVQTAISITGADRGNIQLIDETSGRLVIAAHRGFERPFLDFWNTVWKGKEACGAAFERGERVVVEDVTLSPVFSGMAALDVMLQAGVRAVQSTPLLSRSGKLMAAFSTYYGTPRRPSERALRLLDLLARQAADIIERAQSEAALRSAYEQAEAATRAKDEFLAVISHELRSPLNSILGYARLLRAGTADTEQIGQMMEIIERNGRAQLRLIEDLLDTSRIITGKLELEVRPVALDNVITAALDVVRPSARAKGVELLYDLDPLASRITGDPERLQQVVWNLLANAIKFTPEGGRVELRTQRVGQRVRITVGDTGKGIEPEFLPYVFDRFRQSDSSSARRFGGLGLGLSLVKQLVELHGGTVEAASDGPGRGATFTVTLPQRAARIEPFIPRQAREVRTEGAIPFDQVPSLNGVRVLVVDDLEEARALLTAILGERGAQVTAVPSGDEAMAILADRLVGRRPDVLILDIAMPGEDGYQVLERVRALEDERGVAPSAQIPVIALTAYGRSEDRLKALAAGFQMHVAKPVEPAELAMVIASLINRLGGVS